MLRLAWMARQTLEEQLIPLSKYVDQGRKTSLSYREEFQLGQRDLTDLLDAESELNAAEKSKAEAHYNLLIATYRVHEAIGNLFTALNLDVDVAEDGITALQANRNRTDTLPVSPDRDTDRRGDPLDHCDNTLLQSTINNYGCVPIPVPQPQQPIEIVAEEVEVLPEIRADGVPIVEHLNFIYKLTELTPESQARLEKVIAALKEIPGAQIEIHAYTDAIGSNRYNLRLSSRRANAILDYLIRGGLDAANLTATGKGESNPIADNETDEGRALNRRVEFIVTQESDVEQTVDAQSQQ